MAKGPKTNTESNLPRKEKVGKVYYIVMMKNIKNKVLAEFCVNISTMMSKAIENWQPFFDLFQILIVFPCHTTMRAEKKQATYSGKC